MGIERRFADLPQHIRHKRLQLRARGALGVADLSQIEIDRQRRAR